ncbi:hypothetical protein KC963_05620, partial [Candidatus Saccharibacteria bacterium]|nr:hypothetical protein [Candidatus Saccharibacteria bacterium]
ADLSAVLSGQVYPSLSAGEHGVQQLDDLNLSPEERAVLTQLGGLRVVSGTAVEFDKTAFAGRNAFYLGAEADTQAESALSRAQLKRDNGVWTVDIAAIAPEMTTLNGTNAQTNPLYDQKINVLGLTQDKKPLVVPDGTDVAKLHVVIDGIAAGKPASGTQVLQSTVLKEATPVDTSAIVGAVGSIGNAFAVVAPNGDVFGAANSGIALLNVGDNAVTQIDASTGANALGGAYKIKLTSNDAQGEASIVRGGTATIHSPTVSLHWSQALQRFFVGLIDVRGSSNNFVTNLLVGRLRDGADGNKKIILRAAVHSEGFKDPVDGDNGNMVDWSGKFDGTTNRIIGFGDNTLMGGRAAAFHVRTMHTSTGKDYVIVNGGVATNDNDFNKLKKQVYSIAVRSLTDPDDQTAGIIDTVPDLSNVNERKAAKVGADDAYLAHDNGVVVDADDVATVTDMHVIGDTVYVSVKGTRDSTSKQERGIFSSRAIF